MSKNINQLSKEDQVWAKLRSITDPDQERDIVDLGYVSHLKISDDKVFYHLHLPDVNPKIKEQYQYFSEQAVEELDWVKRATSVLAKSPKRSSMDAAFRGLKDVTHIIAVSSCKGGVGKSTVATNLAFSLGLNGYKVGLFDADVYGPSLPTMVGLTGEEMRAEGQLIIPIESRGLKLMSFGFVNDDAKPNDAAIMRGPMVSQVINQLLTGTKWGELDYLIIDLPPGTGDVQLTLTQMLPITCAVIVTTPQHLAYIDVVKGIDMFKKVVVPTVAVVENMASFTADDGKTYYPFGKGAMDKLQDEYSFDISARLPIVPDIASAGDTGLPIVVSEPNSDVAHTFDLLAKQLVTSVEALAQEVSLQPEVMIVPGKGVVLHDKKTHTDTVLESVLLRNNCQCAHCVNEFTGEKLLDESETPADIEPLAVNPIGNYAVGVTWSDGHSSVYPFQFLSTLN